MLDLPHLRNLLRCNRVPLPWGHDGEEITGVLDGALVFPCQPSNSVDSEHALVVAAVNALPELLDEIEALRDEVSRWRSTPTLPLIPRGHRG